MQLQDIETILKVAPVGSTQRKEAVATIVSDSRKVVPGAVFVAIRGMEIDGHDCIPQAVEKGCLAVVGEREPASLKGRAVPWFQVEDSAVALGDLAAAWNGNPGEKLRLIGLTGTNGKTTTSWLLEHILQQAGHRVGVIGTVNYRYEGQNSEQVVHPASLTTPDALTLHALLREMVEAGVDTVLIEASSHALAQHRLDGLRFDVALLTNVTRDHLDYHQTMTAYFAAKKRLFVDLLKEDGAAVVVDSGKEQEEEYASELLLELASAKKIRKISVGYGAGCAVCCGRVEQTLRGSVLPLELDGQEYMIHSGLIGRHNVLNMLAASGVAMALHIPGKIIQAGLQGIGEVPGRLERVTLKGLSPEQQPAVFVDFAHTPDGLEHVLTTLKSMVTGRLVCVVGCGGDRDQGKRLVMGEIAGRLADCVVLTSDNPRSEKPEAILAEIEQGVLRSGKKKLSQEEVSQEQGLQKGYLLEGDRRRAIHLACGSARPEDVVLIAGKGHETSQLIGEKRHYFVDRFEGRNGLARWTVAHLLAATGGRLLGEKNTALLGGITIDSRIVQNGDVFLALHGENFDGHDFLAPACEKGAGALLVDRDVQEITHALPVIVVEDTLKALGDLAAYRRRLLREDCTVVAMTGSSGKTTVKEMTAAIFAQYYAGEEFGPHPVLKTKGNYNNLIGLPLSLLPLSAEHQVAILEMGMNRVGEIARLTAIADPDIACITNVQAAHLEELGNLEGVTAAKGELFAGLREAAIRVINYDDPQVVKLAGKFLGPSLGFAVTAAGRRHKPEVRVTRTVGLGAKGSRFTLQIGGWKKRLSLVVPGVHNVHNAAAAAAICTAAGVDPESIVQGLDCYRTMDKRMEFVNLPGGLRCLNDCYNANPSSMAAALKTVVSFCADCRKIAALGDMLELGENALAAHYEIGQQAARLGYDMLALTGNFSREVARGAREGGMGKDQVHLFGDTVAIADWLYHLLISGQLSEDDWLLVKGSRGMRMEKLLVEVQNRFDPAFGQV